MSTARPRATATDAAPISPLTARLSAYIAAAPRTALPSEVIEKAKHHLLDTLAAMISGSRLGPGTIALSYVASLGGKREACVPGSRLVTSAYNAALAGGMLAHADETDDSHQPSFHHPGCAVVPAALAMAEREHRTGTQLLRALALGYDIGARASFALGAVRFHLAGHSTHSFGAHFGATAAACALAGLDAAKVRSALSYAAQQASGVSCWMRDPDHIEKAFDFGGMPASHGLAAAAMVAHGFTGVPDVFAGERNFFVAYASPHVRPEALIEELGVTFEIMNSNLKKWSVGSPIQAALDSTQALVSTHRINAREVKRAVVEIQDHEAAIVNDRDMPDICLQHLVALVLIDGTVTFVSSHDVARMKDRQVRAVRRLIELVPSPALTAAGGRQAIVTLHLADGRALRHHTEVVKGTAQNPMTRVEVEAKCDDLLTPILGKRRTRALIERVWTLDKLKDVCELRPLLRA
ncbi:MAG: MmgE/PrpD family protein [Proteobacteria bacterium]|nr:MmgE/PrpD family protein [Burkholderiales bacterium]